MRTDAVAAAGDGGVFHVGSAFEHVGIDRLWPPYARRGRLKVVVTVYDLIPELFPELYLQDPGVRRGYRSRLELIRQADGILAISAATGADVVTRLAVPPARVRVVGTGVDERFHPTADPEGAFTAARGEVPGLEDGYLLYTGGIEPRKNIDRLLHAYSLLPGDLREAHQLVIVCRVLTHERVVLEAELERLGIADRVLFPGYVGDPELVALYQACHLFIFPSLYEGFGLPVAEALACGAPALASANSSLVELVGEDARFDPYSPSSIAAAMERALTDDAFRVGLRRNDLPSWRDVAARTVEAYEDVQARPSRRSRRARPRLAFVSPLPPQPSGVADSSYRLLEALRERCEVDAFADGHEIGTPWEAEVPAGVNVSAASSFDRCARARGGYDRIVYCLGNSEYHGNALALLRTNPGVVIAHDLRLSGLYAWAARERPDVVPRSFHETLQRMYGDRIPAWVGEHGWLDLDDADRYGIFMAKDVLASSERFLVHSQYAAQLAALEAAPADAGKIGVIPFGIVSPEAFSRPDHEPPPLVATFGIATAAKQTEKIVEAFGSIARSEETTRFAVVGAFHNSREEALAKGLAMELGIADRTEFTGRVDEDEFHAWMARTTVAVQLRSWSNGETSGTITDCLAAGIPTVVTGIGWAAELPDACVVKVDADISPSDLGREITGLLANPGRREELRAAGVAYAREQPFTLVAAILLEEALGMPRSAARAA
jgi:glycosyltransferase involved in cell wall biosynthesis